MAFAPRRAEPPRIPLAPPGVVRAEVEARKQRHSAEIHERRSMVRGLLLLALLILVFSIAHAGLDRVFPHGWWHR